MTGTSFETRLLDLRNVFIRRLPDRVAAIAETLRRRLDGENEGANTLERQFHNLAGTAGTYGLLAIAASAQEGLDECSRLDGERIGTHARALWSVVEELTRAASDHAASDCVHFESTPEGVFRSMSAPGNTALAAHNGGRS